MIFRLTIVLTMLSSAAYCQDSVQFLFERAQLHTQRGHYDSALADLELITTTDLEDRLSIARFKILLLHQLGRYNDMERVGDEYFADDPDGAEVHIILGSSNMERANFAAAYSHFTKVVESHPELPIGYIMRSLSLAQMENMEAARRDLEVAERGDVNGFTQIELDQISTVFNILEDFTKAKNYADKGLTKEPTAQTYTNSGWALWGLKRYRESIDMLTKSLAIRPDFIAYLYRGKSYYMVKDYQRAESDLKKSLSIQPNLEQSYVFLGHIYQSQKKMKDACDCWRRAYSISKEEDIAEEIKRNCK